MCVCVCVVCVCLGGMLYNGALGEKLLWDLKAVGQRHSLFARAEVNKAAAVSRYKATRPQGHSLVTCPQAHWAGWLALRSGWDGALPALQKLQGPVTPKPLSPSLP